MAPSESSTRALSLRPQRPPLGDATTRVNNCQPPLHRDRSATHASSKSLPHHESRKPENNLQILNTLVSPVETAANKHLLAVFNQEEKTANRISQISTTSTDTLGKRPRKTHVGPWHLGKTLGKGATGRVRYARHKLNGQPAAVKIVSKAMAVKMQSKSIAAMDQILSSRPATVDGHKTMPSGIEREVIILKLIEHKNIISLYDVWENRGEIYLIMEYVEGGELYSYIDKHKRLSESESVRIFRQILSGLAYCHCLNIYHRDLKPENILLDKDDNVKLVDFGMAALQPQGKWLKTSCGSPHYAPPEIAWGHKYRGAPADVWSSGVVLYAMLCGTLPFGTGREGEDPRDVLKEVVKGEIYVPEDIGEEAEDLILRMLQLKPDNRITVNEIWDHPLMRKYEPYTRHQTYAKKWFGGPPKELSEQDCGKQMKRRNEIDRDLLRSLCILWQYAEEELLIAILLSTEPCYEKVFYNKLVKYRDDQLENYQGSILEFSTSDYHHISKPQMRRSSTQYSLQGLGHTRRNSKLSIPTDNVRRPSQASGRQSSEAETEQSYDPYRSSRPQMVDAQANNAKITVHRGESDASGGRRTHSGAPSLRVPALGRVQSGAVYSISSSPPPLPTTADGRPLTLRRNLVVRNYSRSSLASSHRSYRQGASGVIRTSSSYKRVVSFDHAKRRSSSRAGSSFQDPQMKETLTLQERYQRDRKSQSTPNPSSPANISTPEPSSSPPVRSRKERSVKSYAEEIAARKSKRGSLYWKEEARKVSSELENLCDEAFNPPFAPAQSTASSNDKHEHPNVRQEPRSCPIANEARFASSSIITPSSTRANEKDNKDQDRPLPKPPLRYHIESKAKDELLKAKELLKRRAADLSPGALDEVIAQIDRLMQQSNLGLSDQDYQRRVASAPARSLDPRLLSPVKEVVGETPPRVAHLQAGHSQKDSRIASDPNPTKYTKHPLSGQYDTDRSTIRLVDYENVPRPAPLVIRKRSADSNQSDKTVEKKSSREPLIKTSTNSGKTQLPSDNELLRPGSRLGFNGDRDSAGLSLLERMLEPIVEDENKENDDPAYLKRHSAGSETKKRPWFRRNRTDLRNSDSSLPPTPPRKDLWEVPDVRKRGTSAEKRMSDVPSEDSSHSEPQQASFGRNRFFRIFTKKDAKDSRGVSELALTGRDLDDAESIDQASTTSGVWMSGALNDSTASFPLRAGRKRTPSGALPLHRSILPQPQNWLARFLHIKPASRIVAFQVSSLRARKEVAGILRDWKRYGMRDIVVDKVAGRIWARVAEENLLAIKPVALALELFPIFVRGRKANLCVGRFTQEKGAKSSFERVLATLEGVLRRRACLVAEKKRAREMRRCLQGR